MTTSPALALPELPVVRCQPADFCACNFIPCVSRESALTYGQQCAQAQGEAQAAEIARLRYAVRRMGEEVSRQSGLHEWAQDWDDFWNAHNAALKSEAA